jgi:transposase-like protein
MIGRETRMLRRHYLEQGASKSALARQLGISRDTIHRWIRAGGYAARKPDHSEGGSFYASDSFCLRAFSITA